MRVNNECDGDSHGCERNLTSKAIEICAPASAWGNRFSLDTKVPTDFFLGNFFFCVSIRFSTRFLTRFLTRCWLIRSVEMRSAHPNLPTELGQTPLKSLNIDVQITSETGRNSSCARLPLFLLEAQVRSSDGSNRLNQTRDPEPPQPSGHPTERPPNLTKS